MNSAFLAGIGIAAVVSVVLVILAFSRGVTVPIFSGVPAATTTAQYGATTSAATSQPSLPSQRASSRNVLALSGNHECLYDSFSTSTQSHDVLDIANGRMHGEFRTMDANGNATNSIMVYDGRYLYAWEEGKTTGTRTRLSSLSQLPEVIPAGFKGAAILGTTGENVSWDCHPWIPDASELAPPSYVRFTAA